MRASSQTLLIESIPYPLSFDCMFDKFNHKPFRIRKMCQISDILKLIGKLTNTPLWVSCSNASQDWERQLQFSSKGHFAAVGKVYALEQIANAH